MALDPQRLWAQGAIVTRAIPSSGERIPVIGLGSSATFAQVARIGDIDALREVFKAMADRGATVFDTAPGYGASEEVVGQASSTELGIADKFFWATKLNVAGRGGAGADPAAARAQVETSFDRIKQGQDRRHPGAQHGRRRHADSRSCASSSSRAASATSASRPRSRTSTRTSSRRCARRRSTSSASTTPSTTGMPRPRSCRSRRSARWASSRTRRSAAPASSAASAIARCPTGPRNSTRRPGRSSP